MTANATDDVATDVDTPLDLERLSQFGQKMQKLTGELVELFPEREHLINQILYALLTREHVLVHGVYGTAKTDLTNALFGAFQNARLHSIALAKFMTEAHVIGIADPRQMREEGRLTYQRDGGILDADLLELDEIFDASSPLLRVLLGILHERLFKRGRQMERANLHTALASTNGDPEVVVKAAPELGAVIDRFLFISRVQYLKEPSNRQKMYRKFVENRRPTTTIDFADLVAATQLVNSNAVPVEDWVLAAHEELVEGYRAAVGKKQVVSDRRACKLLQLVRASAVLHGTLEITPEDLLAERWGLCLGGDQAQHDAFNKVAEGVIAKVKQSRKQDVDELCAKLLSEYDAAVPVVPAANAPDAEVLAAYKRVNQLLRSTQSVTPQVTATQHHKEALVKKLTTLAAQLNARLAG